MELGKAAQVENYRESLTLNPDNEGARKALKSMGVNE
jgi:hypothetical protein